MPNFEFDPQVAQTFLSVAQEMGANRAQTLALLSAGLVESNMQTIDYGDRDSLGPLQQRPSQGWGTPDQVQDPAYAARAFLERAMAIEGFNGPGDLAAQVQRPAEEYRGRYAERMDDARWLLHNLDGGTATEPAAFDPSAPDEPDVAQDDEMLTGIISQISDHIRQQPGPEEPVEETPEAVPEESIDPTPVDETAVKYATPRPDEAQDPDVVSGLVGSLGEDGLAQALAQLGDLGVPGDETPAQDAVEGSPSEFIEIASQWIGVPYLWGGTDPSKGLDCSGLIQTALKQMGIDAPRVSRDQANFGRPVSSLEEARPGDLVAFNSPVSHIGIYLGGGKMLHAPRTGRNVEITTISDREVAAIRRIFGGQ